MEEMQGEGHGIRTLNLALLWRGKEGIMACLLEEAEKSYISGRHRKEGALA